MNTLTLQEALERATKGPLKASMAFHGLNARLIIDDSHSSEMVSIRIAGVNPKIVKTDAALLAHCRNELPALVEASIELSQAMKRFADWSNPLHAHELECASTRFDEALRSAQTVKMP